MMGTRNNLLLAFFLFLMNVACVSQTTSCGCSPAPPKIDATQMPYKSFAFVSSDSIYTPDECKEEDKLDDGTCKPNIERYGGSGVFIFRSVKTSSVAYLLTARHVCEHKDEKPAHGKLLMHEFNIRDYYGQRHHATFFFTSKLYDACVLAIDDVGQGIKISRVASETPDQGERVFNLSAPHGIFGPGMVLTFEGFYSGQQRSTSMFTIPASPGSSGSPVYNTKGDLVSMLWSVPSEETEDGTTVQMMENISIGLLLSNIRDTLSSLETMDELFGPPKSSAKDQSVGP